MTLSKVRIIAEAGVNHNGSLDLAKKLVDAGKECGVDIVKFQLAIPEFLVSKSAKMAEYQIANIGKECSQLEMIKKISLTFDEHKELMNYCKEHDVIYLCTPFDLPSIDFLYKNGHNIWKIPSGEITNFPYLRKIASLNGEVIMSTGMCSLWDIESAVNTLIRFGQERAKITILHCNTEYPTPFTDVNLKAMIEIGEKFGVKIGYSDHTQGIEVPIAAVALGATVIEKHFTLNRNMEGPDHKASLEPDELKNMVSAIRNIEQAIGTGHKTISESERKNIEIARKSIVAACHINKGEIFTEDNLMVKRPGNGISPMLWEDILGRIAIHDFEEDEKIEL